MMRLSTTPDMDAIFVPSLSPIIGSLNLLKPSVLDFAWLRASDGNVQVDWLAIGLTVAFIVFCTVMLSRSQFAFRHSPFAIRNPHLASRNSQFAFRISQFAISLALVLVIALSFFSLYRYRGDVRFGGSEGYRALLQTIAHQEQPRDVMILNNDLVAPFFFNENRARLRWYGLSRDPQQFDEATRALLARLAQRYTRVWFVYDDAAPDLPDPTRAWLDESLQRLDERDFDDGVHLILYATRLQP
jgi:hypothetical protein